MSASAACSWSWASSSPGRPRCGAATSRASSSPSRRGGGATRPAEGTVSSSITRAAVIGLAVVAVALLALLLYPIASALLFATVLAGSFHPRVKAFARRLGGRRALAAAITTVVVALVIVLPLTSLALVLGSEAIEAVDYVRTSLRSG